MRVGKGLNHPGIWPGWAVWVGRRSQPVLGLGAMRVCSLLPKEGGYRVSPISWACVPLCSVWIYPVETDPKHMAEKRGASWAVLFHSLQSCASPTQGLSRITP